MTGTGVKVDNGTHNLAKSGLNATGAVAILKHILTQEKIASVTVYSK